jgi:hypothetical protein
LAFSCREERTSEKKVYTRVPASEDPVAASAAAGGESAVNGGSNIPATSNGVAQENPEPALR